MRKKNTEARKLIVILGQTAAGKSDLAVSLAKRFNGEIISADSRQVYKGLNLGTGKISKKEMRGVPHHLLDVLSPKKQFSAAEYKEQASKIIEILFKKEKLPIVCGGTGFYIDALLGTQDLPLVPPNPKLRKQLEKLSLESLFQKLTKIDPRRAKEIDRHNPRRLIRALEIALSRKSPKQSGEERPDYRVLKIGLAFPKEELRKHIHDRLLSRIKKGLITEIKRLHEKGLPWKKMEDFGLEYRYLSRYLKDRALKRKRSGLDVVIKKLESEIWRYAKRQMTWFKKDQSILWFHPRQYEKTEKTVKKFLNKKSHGIDL